MNSIIIDIELELSYIEIILKKYNLIDENFKFVYGYRDPICMFDKHLLNYVNPNNVSSKPYHPYISAYVIRDMMYCLSLDLTDNKNLFYKNTLSNEIDPVYDDIFLETRWLEIEDIIFKYVPNINKIDYNNIMNIWYENIYKKIYSTFEHNHNDIWNINIERSYFRLDNLGSIYEYRYKQLERMKNG